jgi:hypothetical protein
MAARCASGGYSGPLHLAAAIIASHDGPVHNTVVRDRYLFELAGLRDLAERNLAHADGHGEFDYGLQVMMAVEDRGVWQRHLEAVAEGEIAMECPRCHDFLVMNLEGSRFRMASFADTSVGSTQVVPVEPTLDSSGQRSVALSRLYGFHVLAARVPNLLSHVVCPRCGDGFDLPDALV